MENKEAISRRQWLGKFTAATGASMIGFEAYSTPGDKEIADKLSGAKIPPCILWQRESYWEAPNVSIIGVIRQEANRNKW